MHLDREIMQGIGFLMQGAALSAGDMAATWRVMQARACT